jgi:hypothetical protein
LKPSKQLKTLVLNKLEGKRKENLDKRLWRKEQLELEKQKKAKETNDKKKAQVSPRINQVKQKPVDLLN